MATRKKKPKGGSSLTDAVVAALAKVDDKPDAGEAAPAAEAGCAATQTASGANGFRNGPGSFADLMRRWAGGAPMAAAAPAAPATSDVPATSDAPAPLPAPDEAPAAETEIAARSESRPAPEPARVDSGDAPLDDDDVDEADMTIADPEPASGGGAPPPAKVDAEEHPELDEEATLADDTAIEVRQDAEPGGAIRVSYYGRTDVGLVREHNEDNYLVADLDENVRNPEGLLDATIGASGCVFAVCDGMGGAAAGEVASQMAVDTVYEVMGATPVAEDRDDFARRLVVAIEEAGQRIFSAAKMDRSRRGMGTTATVAGMVDNVLFVGQVGDSRAYVLRGDQFAQVTKDQSLVNQLIEAGQLTEEEAEAFEHSNIILQALGTTEEVTVDLTFLELRKGDRMMMCSDGLSGLVHGEMIKEVLQGTEDQTEAAAKLIQMANAGGGHDNITVIVADYEGPGLSDDVTAPVRYQQYPLPPSDKHRKSLPPRAMSMKPGATKPGADVKRDNGVAGPSEDIEVPTEGGNGMLYVMLIVLVLVGAAGAWFLWGRGGDAVGDTPPPPATPTDVVPEDPEPVVDPVEDPVEPARGTLNITSDVEDGTLYVNGQLHGPLVDRMAVELEPGGYTLVVRSGETDIASQTVTVSEGAAQDVDLSVPVGAVEDLPAPETPSPGADDQGSASGRRGGGASQRRGAGRQGGQPHGGGGGGAHGGGRDDPPPNPF